MSTKRAKSLLDEKLNKRANVQTNKTSTELSGWSWHQWCIVIIVIIVILVAIIFVIWIYSSSTSTSIAEVSEGDILDEMTIAAVSIDSSE